MVSPTKGGKFILTYDFMMLIPLLGNSKAERPWGKSQQRKAVQFMVAENKG